MGAHGVWAFGVGLVRGSRLLLFGLHLPLVPEGRAGVRVRGEGSSVAASLRLQFWGSTQIPSWLPGKVWHLQSGIPGSAPVRLPAGASAERVTMSGLRMLPSALSR